MLIAVKRQLLYLNYGGQVKMSVKEANELLERYTQYPSLILKTRPWDFKTFSCIH
jgi:hypothetical protein